MKILTRKICGVYKITNLVNGMSYIGQSRHVYNRWAQHRHGRNKDHNYYLCNAINKYGIDNFSFEILQECSIDRLNDLERQYIIQYNSLKPNGYNLEKGGGQGKVIAAETRKRMSISSVIRWLSPITDEERQRRQVAHHKPVSQYTREGVYIRTFQSIKEAAKSVGAGEGNITVCCKKGNQQTAGGFQWRHGSNTRSIEPVSYKPHAEGHKIPVAQYSLNGKYLKTYPSFKEAASVIGITSGCISACVNGKQKTAGGFVWRVAK